MTQTLAAVTGQLVCPQCRNSYLTLLQTASAECRAAVYRSEGGEVETEECGSTDIDEYTYTTVGVQCEGCDFAYVGADWADQLAVVSHDIVNASTPIPEHVNAERELCSYSSAVIAGGDGTCPAGCSEAARLVGVTETGK